ncbi:hypothetical protein ACVIW2_004544 [Bradyrhizobium huanghuaihaiense]|jgi:hypothetical protein|uniref:Uncharacterized protein n=3 Tax=Bradyrhizobium TaxID=374 RepID=A0A810CNK8_9BRAD|nr:hypothetical protein [Bradyrhizobium japonicum]BCE88791.1 hypothetical protein XF10B_15890 [Bradyrhizobium diazoefficiens]MCP1791578.1 hypothetical protein [Bradyrhizobium japonicum]MCP1803998.1 hypothetical protein [Bradyrhizobium japonicum]MCP1813021.1 hypothetical protein [Bradyrhizobium japonicum]
MVRRHVSNRATKVPIVGRDHNQRRYQRAAAPAYGFVERSEMKLIEGFHYNVTRAHFINCWRAPVMEAQGFSEGDFD